MLNRLFLQHPADVGESYSEHMRQAVGIGLTMLGGGFACLIHAAVPALFKTRGSAIITRLHAQLINTRGTKRDAAAEPHHSG